MTEEQIRAHLGEEFYERHARVQKMLKEAADYYRRKAAAERRASGSA